MKARKVTSRVLEQLMSEIKPIDFEKTEVKMIISANIEDRMIELEISKGDLAIRTNRNNSEITKWLSGTQNFTIDTLVEISNALDTTIIKLLS